MDFIAEPPLLVGTDAYCGIDRSLNDVAPNVPSPGNMFVPVNDLKPALADLLQRPPN